MPCSQALQDLDKAAFATAQLHGLDDKAIVDPNEHRRLVFQALHGTFRDCHLRCASAGRHLYRDEQAWPPASARIFKRHMDHGGTRLFTQQAADIAHRCADLFTEFRRTDDNRFTDLYLAQVLG
ncbi:hypothetical protein D3C85_1050040 [compost metagenome]